MNKSEAATALATATGLSNAKAAEILNALFDGEKGIITAALQSGDQVSFQGFGTFKVAERKARTAKNPKTGETLQVAAKKAPKFTAGKNLKSAVA